ncbi:MAG: LPS export ABC transporter permease LptG [Legionella sp.]
MIGKLLDRYIAKIILSAIGLVTLLLAGLQLFILFVSQVDAIGKANFDVFEAGLFVFLQMPYQVYLFFPMASLLGSLIGLGIMANHHELVVIRAAGMSIWQVSFAVIKAAVVVIMLVTIIGETLVPKLSHFANNKKLQAMSKGHILRTTNGTWLRFQNNFINVGTILADDSLHQINQFQFDNEHHLRFTRHIDRAQFIDNHWHAYQVVESQLADKITTCHRDQMIWDIPLTVGLLSAGRSEPDEMTLSELSDFLGAEKYFNRNKFNYQLAFWQRITQPITTLVMMILAIPFIFGPLRSSTMGYKLLIGATVGFGFNILNRFFGPISQVMQWPVEIAAFAPTSLCIILGIYLMRRAK